MDKQENIIDSLAYYKGLVFDLDGTLIQLSVRWEALKRELQQYCYENKQRSIVFTPLNKALQQCEKEYGPSFYRKLMDIVSRYETEGKSGKLHEALINYINASANQLIAIYSMNSRKCVEDFV